MPKKPAASPKIQKMPIKVTPKPRKAGMLSRVKDDFESAGSQVKQAANTVREGYRKIRKFTDG